MKGARNINELKEILAVCLKFDGKIHLLKGDCVALVVADGSGFKGYSSEQGLLDFSSSEELLVFMKKQEPEQVKFEISFAAIWR